MFAFTFIAVAVCQVLMYSTVLPRARSGVLATCWIGIVLSRYRPNMNAQQKNISAKQ